MSYNVYKIKYTIAIPDPDMPSPRYHHVIFVETHADGGGVIHNVTGDITSGMHYETENSGRPENSETFFEKEYLGKTKAVDYLFNID
ncbi:hypothetical protein B7463_g10379, partial [Scytalidium lignicola]